MILFSKNPGSTRESGDEWRVLNPASNGLHNLFFFFLKYQITPLRLKNKGVLTSRLKRKKIKDIFYITILLKRGKCIKTRFWDCCTLSSKYIANLFISDTTSNIQDWSNKIRAENYEFCLKLRGHIDEWTSANYDWN